MQFRLGTCSSCGAQYKVPASFEANQARCKACGGVVEIGPVQSDEAEVEAAAPAKAPAAAEPAAATAAKPAPAQPAAASAPEPAPPEPAPKKKREGPSMKEQLLARRAAEARARAAEGQGTAQPAARPAPKAAPAAKPAAARPVPAKQVAKPVAVPAKPAAAPRKGPAKPAARDAEAAEGEAAPARAGRAGKRAGARGGRSGSRAGRSGARGRGAGREKKKGNPLLLVGSVVGLLVVAAALWFVMGSGDDAVEAKNDEAVAAADAAGATVTDEVDGSAADDEPVQDEPTQDGEGDGTSGEPEPNAAAAGVAGTAGEAGGAGDDRAATADDGPAPDAREDATAAAASGADETAAAGDAAAKEDAPPAKAPAQNVDLSEVDLTAIEDFGPIEGVDEERWANLQKWAAQMIDLDAGAAGNRARKKLFEAGKEAFPAVMNEFKRLDFTTDQGRKDGDLYQRLLTDLCNGNNFGWKYTTEPRDALYNKKVVRLWAGQWEKAQDNEEYWLRLSKQKPIGQESPEDDAKEKRKQALDALDDI